MKLHIMLEVSVEVGLATVLLRLAETQICQTKTVSMRREYEIRGIVTLFSDRRKVYDPRCSLRTLLTYQQKL